MSLIFDPTQTEPSSLDKIGGKAASLYKMQSLGVRVPKWYALTTDAWQLFLEHNSIDLNLAKEHREALISEVMGGEFPDILHEEIFRVMSQPEFELVSVRSSSVFEDGVQHSFAGQFHSELGVDRFSVMTAIKLSWVSLFSENILRYVENANVSTFDFSMAVILQVQIHADSAGVVFTRSPFNGIEESIVCVESVWGMGNGLVDGELDADSFEISRLDFAVKNSTIAKKPSRYRISGIGKLALETTPEGLREKPSLHDHQLRLLVEDSIRLEVAYSCPLDIEWCVAEEKIYFLQARPITTLPNNSYFDSASEAYTLFDNSNIIESYSGVVYPLTFSFASRAYEKVYRQFCEVMCVPQDIINQNSTLFSNMLCYFKGRVFYNLINWYKLVFLFPNADRSSSFMETMMGVQNSLDEKLKSKFNFEFEAYRPKGFERVMLAARTLYRFFTIKKTIADFDSYVKKEFATYESLAFEKMNLSQLLNRLSHFKSNVIGNWKAPILNDCRCMIFFGIFDKISEKWISSDELRGQVKNMITSDGHLISMAPFSSLKSISRELADGVIPGLELLLSNLEDKKIYEMIVTDEHYSILYTRIRSHIDRFGFRCPEELKLETIDYHLDPVPLVAFLRQNISHPQQSESKSKEMQETLFKLRDDLGWLKFKVFSWIKNSTAAAIADREFLRLHRTTAYGLIRRMYRAIGSKLASLNMISELSDIFYLNEQEIEEAIEGRSFHYDFRGVIEERKRIFASYSACPTVTDRFVTKYPSALAQSYEGIVYQNSSPSSATGDLTGTPCSPGVVNGEIHIARSFEEASSVSGRILVTERTDPGWVPLYGACSGLIIERGSMLSHSAIVARELGLPTIVGAKGSIDRLKQARRVEMDGARGTVKILE